MITAVIMKRELFGNKISQNSKSEFFSANDLIKAGNKWRIENNLSPLNLQEMLRNESFIEFRKVLENKHGACITATRGRKGETWVHPLLFIELALTISPKLKVEVYEWLFDHLIKNRNNSGDSYKEMAAALYVNYGNKSDFPRYIAKVADYIRESIGVEKWELATQDQLKKRDDIHKAIKTLTLVLTDPNQCVRVGVGQYKRLLD